MDLSFDDDQEAARQLLRRGLQGLSGGGGSAGVGAGHRGAAVGGDRLRVRLGELGVWGMGVPEAAGGAGAALEVLVVVAEEAGRAIVAEPVVEHQVATRLLARLKPEDPALAGCAEGKVLAAFAPMPATGGTAGLVPGGAAASVVVVLDGDQLVAVEASPPAAPANHADLPVADRDLDVEGRRVLATGEAARREHARAAAEWRLLTAGVLVGVAQRALELAVAYVQERHQFGVPIGSFQALQHGLAELPGPIDGARLLAHEAAWAVATGERSVTGACGEVLATMALCFAGDVARQATARCVQYHGGYGYAEEYEAQRLYRHARGTALAGGGTDGLLDDVATAIEHGEAG